MFNISSAPARQLGKLLPEMLINCRMWQYWHDLNYLYTVKQEIFTCLIIHGMAFNLCELLTCSSPILRVLGHFTKKTSVICAT